MTLIVLAMTGCTTPPALTARVATHRMPAAHRSGAAATPPVAPTVAPPVPTGPPPTAGSLAWYVAELPHFAAPPPPARLT